MILGLRTVVYHVADIERAKAWYAEAFDVEPYFEESYYVGFNIGGYELGLDPDISKAAPGPGGAVAYWGVLEIGVALDHFLKAGAVEVEPIREVGGGIKVATVADPFGNRIVLIENPHFAASTAS